MNYKEIKIKILSPLIQKDLSNFKYMTPGSAGIDLRSCLNSEVMINPLENILIPTGISIYIKNPLVAGLVIPRSSLGHIHGIILGNSIGLVDSDYQGEIKVSLWNRSKKKFIIYPGDRIAQLVFLPVFKPVFTVVKDYKIVTKRGKKGFGYSGRR